MVSEASIGRIRELHSRLANLVVAERNNMIGNERAISDGSSQKISGDIAAVRTQMGAFYKSNVLSISTAVDQQLLISSDDAGKTFNLLAIDLSRPGVMKKVETSINRDQIADLVDYVGGGGKVLHGGMHVDPALVLESTQKLLNETVEELRMVRRELSTTMAELEAIYQNQP